MRLGAPARLPERIGRAQESRALIVYTLSGRDPAGRPTRGREGLVEISSNSLSAPFLERLKSVKEAGAP